MKKFKKNLDSHENSNELGSGFWISFTDLMSCLLLIVLSLLFFFLIRSNYYSSVMKDLDECRTQLTELRKQKSFFEKQYEQASKKINDLNAELSRFGKTDDKLHKIVSDIRKDLIDCGYKYLKNVNVRQSIILDEDTNTIHLSDRIVHFDSGESNIESEDSLMFIRQCVGLIFLNHLDNSAAREIIDSVFIEGHTDSNKFADDKRDFKNWNLSAERAIEFWYQLRSSFGRIAFMRNGNNDLLFSVSGYADTRPASNCTDPYYKTDISGRSIQMCNEYLTKKDSDEKNRRIDIKFKALYKLNNK